MMVETQKHPDGANAHGTLPRARAIARITHTTSDPSSVSISPVQYT